MNKIEAEGGELAIKNKNGDIAIIPKERVKHVQNLIQSGKHSQVDAFIAMLPKMKGMAGGGTVIEGEDPKPEKTHAQLQAEYGKGVKYAEIYIPLYDKPIQERTIREEHYITEKNPRLKGKALEYQNKFFESEQKEREWKANFENSMNIMPDFRQGYSPDNEASMMFRNLTPEERKTSPEYNKFIQDREQVFRAEQQGYRDKFYTDPSNTTYHKQEATSMRKLIENRNDIQDKELFYAGFMDEGGDKFVDRNKGGTINPYDGYELFGVDRIGERLDEFEKRGFIDKQMRNRINLKNEVNEKGENVVSADFLDVNDIITTSNAFIRSGKASVIKQAEKLGVNLTKQAEAYFTYASFNLGEAGAKQMMAAYHEKGLLDKYDTFMNDDAYPGYRENINGVSAHWNAKRRVQRMNMLKGEGTLKDKIAFQKKTDNFKN